jgi:protocatechuate 3,4-dioxygenase beta subunit
VRVPEQPDYEHDILLPVAGISGTVRNSDGSLARDCRVSLMVEGAVPNSALLGEHYAEIATDERGNYELVWLHAGTYTVGVGGSSFGGMFGSSSTAPPRQLRSGLRVSEGEWLRGVDFELGEPGSIHGSVRDAAGKPLSGAAIFVRDGQGRLLERLSMLTSDSAGRFDVPGLEPGEYALLARTTDLVTGHDVRAVVRKGEASEVELVVSGGTKLIISLANEQGERVDCRVEVTDQDGRQVNGMMSLEQVMAALAQGRFSTKEQEIGPLAPGKYRVVATTTDGKTVTKPVTLSGQPERRLNLTL